MENRKHDNTVRVGEKPFLNYVTAVAMQFTAANEKKIVISARGKFISKAVDISEVVKNRFLKEQNIKIEDIKTGSEEFKNKDGKDIRISFIDITLTKP